MTTPAYLDYPEAVELHIKLMWRVRETRFGVADRTLVESALARPQQAAFYEAADLIRQAATLCFGLIKNHPWRGGNKRTATFLTHEFLRRNGWKLVAMTDEIIELSLAVEADRWKVDEIEGWLRNHTVKIEEGK